MKISMIITKNNYSKHNVRSKSYSISFTIVDKITNKLIIIHHLILKIDKNSTYIMSDKIIRRILSLKLSNRKTILDISKELPCPKGNTFNS
jgi:hypothetical protein